MSKLKDFNPAEYNPRLISDAAKLGLAKSLEVFGDLSGLVVNKKTGNIISGHQRSSILKDINAHPIKWGDYFTAELGPGTTGQDGRFVSKERLGVLKLDNGRQFGIREVEWPIEFEKAANVSANNPSIQGEFTDDLEGLLDELKDQEGDLFSGLMLDDLHDEYFGETAGKKDDAEGMEKQIGEFKNEDRQAVEFMAGYKTSIARKEPSAPYQYYQDTGLLVGDVLDYGGGRDAHGGPIYDPAYAPDLGLLKKKWDTVTCNYVLNVIPLVHNRAELLLALRSIVKPGGYVLVAVFQKADQESASEKGYQCGWNQKEWQKFLGQFFKATRLKVSNFWGWKLKP